MSFKKRFQRELSSSKKLITSIIFFGVIVALLYSYTQPKEYEAKATIEVKFKESISYEYAMMRVATKMEIIKSNSILARVLKRVDLSHRYYKSINYIDRELYHNSPFSVYLTKGYNLHFHITPLDKVSYRLRVEGRGWEYDSIHRYHQRVSNSHFNLILKPKEGISFDSDRYSFVVDSNTHILKSIKERIEVSQVGDSAIISIIYRDTIPSRAKIFISTLIDEAIKYSRGELPSQNQIKLSTIQLGEVCKTKESSSIDISKLLIGLSKSIGIYSLPATIPKITPTKPEPKEIDISSGDIRLDTLNSLERRYSNYAIFLIIGAMLALLIALLIVTIRSILPHKIDSYRELKAHTKSTIIGLIPHTKIEFDEEGMVVPNLIQQEVFRDIRNSIRFMATTQSTQVIAVTSTVDGEGKSSISANLAQSISLDNQRVVVLDLDMQLASLHKRFNLFNDEGMSSVLSNQAMISEVIRYTDNKSLDVATAGAYPPNIYTLINSDRLIEVIEKLKNVYDVIILNMPSITKDITKVLEFADTTIYVIKAGKIDIEKLDKVDKIGRQIRNFTVVLNGIKG
jgi:capsular exopolysaccharide synthesis family protein